MGKQIKDLAGLVTPLVAAPAIVLMLRLIPYFELVPLRRWGLAAGPVTFTLALGGAAVAMMLPARNSSNRVKLKSIMVSLATSSLSPFVYNYVSSTPPSRTNSGYYGLICLFFFLLSYFSQGYCL